MLALNLLVACLPYHPRPDSVAPVILSVDAIAPGYATTSGGIEAALSGSGFGEDSRVFFGDAEAVVLHQDEESLVVEVPAAELAGYVDVRVESAGLESSVDHAFRYFVEGEGLAGTFGAVEWTELQGSYWEAGSEDFGSAWVGLIEPADVHYWDIFGVDEDKCSAQMGFPEMDVMDLGVDALTLEASGRSLELAASDDRFFERSLGASDFVGGASWGLDVVSGGSVPDFSITELARAPSEFELYSPAVFGDEVEVLDQKALDVEWSAVDADRVVVLVEVLDQDFEPIQSLGCVVRNDGAFSVPASDWEHAWGQDQWIFVYVGAVKEGAGKVPFNNAESRVAGIWWNLGAGLSSW